MLKSYLANDRRLGEKRAFHLQSRLTIGRAPKSDIHLPNLSISRQHAIARVENEKAIFEDMDSRNGTYLSSSGERCKRVLQISRALQI